MPGSGWPISPIPMPHGRVTWPIPQRVRRWCRVGRSRSPGGAEGRRRVARFVRTTRCRTAIAASTLGRVGGPVPRRHAASRHADGASAPARAKLLMGDPCRSTTSGEIDAAIATIFRHLTSARPRNLPASRDRPRARTVRHDARVAPVSPSLQTMVRHRGIVLDTIDEVIEPGPVFLCGHRDHHGADPQHAPSARGACSGLERRPGDGALHHAGARRGRPLAVRFRWLRSPVVRRPRPERSVRPGPPR